MVPFTAFLGWVLLGAQEGVGTLGGGGVLPTENQGGAWLAEDPTSLSAWDHTVS